MMLKNVSSTCFLLAGMLLFGTIDSMVAGNGATKMHPTHLTCEYLTNPMGIDIPTPRLSWQLESTKRRQRQTACRILVSSTLEGLRSDRGELWDSTFHTDQSVGIRYSGTELTSGTVCYWKVRVWDQNGRISAWSSPAKWSIGLLHETDWSAKWIGLDRPVGSDDTVSNFTRLSARMLRKEFSVSKQIRRATAYVCGLGLFEFYVDGRKMTNDVFVPACTEYNKRSLYLTFDITRELRNGTNALGVLLGNGRYFAMRHGDMANYGFPKLLLQLNIEYTDGSMEKIVSDESWKLTADGPIRANNEYDGEEYDARKELPGWTLPGFHDDTWMNAALVQPPSERLEAQMSDPLMVMDSVKPVSVNEINPGTYIIDLGQNIVGWARVNLHGKRGDTLTMRFAERLKDDGTLYLDNLRTAKVTDIYVMKGGGPESWQPRFTYHGFRYIEVKGFPGKPSVASITGEVVYDAIATTGSFSTSNHTINALWKNAYWGIRGNYRSMPTDCPQRDERMGWLGDRATGSKGESFMFDNNALYAKWLTDINDAQAENGSVPDVAPSYWKNYNDNTTWPGAYIIIADMLYDQFGNDEPIRKHYASMKKWMAYMRDQYMKDYLMTKDTYGDWCMPPESMELIHSRDPKRKTSGEVIGTTYYYYLLGLMQRFAHLQGMDSTDAREFGALASHMREAFNRKYFDIDRKQYRNNTATANILALAYGMVPPEYENDVVENILAITLGDFRGHISTGLVGAQWLMRTLTKYGRPDIAYRLATNTTYPSWGYMTEHGATTIWELWNGNTADPAMNSGNHVMLLGDLITWCYEDILGIASDREHPGFQHIIMKPTITGDLTFAKGSYRSVYGMVASGWEYKNGTLRWNVTVPANASATVYLPSSPGCTVTESGIDVRRSKEISFVRSADGYSILEVGSGSYSFSVKGYFPAVIKQTVESPIISPADTTVASASKAFATISCPTNGATIYYTLDGTEPTQESLLYTVPLNIGKSVTITARAFKSGFEPSYKSSSNIDVYDPIVNGLHYAYFEGKWDTLPEFASMHPLKTGKSVRFDLDAIKAIPEYYGIQFSGYVDMPADDEYTFSLTSDDGSKLSIDGKAIVLNDGTHGMDEKTGVVFLTRGKHEIAVDYFQYSGGAGLVLTYSSKHIASRPVPVSSLYYTK